MNYQLLISIAMCSVTGGLGYLLAYVHQREAIVFRVQRGLSAYLRHAAYSGAAISR
jgi:hypothetical protein